MEAGSITFSTALDNKQLEKDLNSLTKKIEKKERDIAELTAKRDEAKGKGALDGAVLDAEKAKLQEIKDRLDEIRARSKDKTLSPEDRDAAKELIPSVKQEYDDQKARVQGLQTEWNKTKAAVERYTAQLAEAEAELDRQKEEAGHIVQQLDEAKNAAGGMGDMIDRAKARMDKLGKRILSLAASALVFNAISAGFRSLQQLTMKYIKTNDEARQAIAQLKGALLTLAQPLIEVIIPAFTLLVNILTRIITAVAQFVSMLFGKTINQSKEGAKALHKEASAIGAVGDAADEAAGSMAGFDEINAINTENAKGAGGAGASGDEIAPDFGDFEPGKYKDIIDELMVYLSGALLVIGAILLFSGANIPLGLGLMVVGAAMLATAVALNWGTMDKELRATLTNTLVILGGFLIVIGAILAFSGANIPLGIGMMIAGAAALTTAAKLNWGEINEELKKTITDIAVLLGVSLVVLGAIIAFSGANVPLGIGLLIAGAASLAAAAALDWDYVSSHIKEILTAITAVLGTGLLALGAILCFSGANVPLGIGLMIAGAASLATAAALNWDKIVTAIQGPIGKIMAIVSSSLLVLGIILCCVGILPLGISLIAAGAAGLVTVAALNWNAILDKIKEVVEGIKTWWDANVAKYLTLDYWKNKGKEIIDGFLDGLKNAWDGLASWFSGVWDNLFSNRKVSVGVNASSSAGNYNSGSRIAASALPSIAPASIPALAQGAVIPPNREFLAVLGDQRSGNNLELPESLLRQIVREEAGGIGDVAALLQQILAAVKAGQIIMVDGTVFGRTAIRTINSANTAAGKQLLLI